MTEIYMEETSRILLQHEVGRMSVAHSHHVCGDTLASEGVHKPFAVCFQVAVAGFDVDEAFAEAEL